MASLAAKAERNQRARARLAAALSALSKRLDIPVPDEPRRMHDADLQPIVEVERFADFAEDVLGAVERLAVEGEPPAGYAALTVKMLRAEAKERGLDIPANATKDDLVALLEEDDATKPEEGEPEEEPIAGESSDEQLDTMPARMHVREPQA